MSKKQQVFKAELMKVLVDCMMHVNIRSHAASYGVRSQTVLKWLNDFANEGLMEVVSISITDYLLRLKEPEKPDDSKLKCLWITSCYKYEKTD